MPRFFQMMALASVALSMPAFAQSVEIKTGPDGQLSGKAEAGGQVSSVDTGTAVRTQRDDDSAHNVVTRSGPCAPGSRSRTVRVVSPDGSSSSSSSVSVSGGGTVSAGGGGSPGSRVYEDDCPQPHPAAATYSGATAAPVSSHRVAANVTPRRHVVAHRRVVRRRR
jgi:hypothetical protein